MRFCPKCKSENVEKDLSTESFAQGSFFNKYKFEGIFFPEKD